MQCVEKEEQLLQDMIRKDLQIHQRCQGRVLAAQIKNIILPGISCNNQFDTNRNNGGEAVIILIFVIYFILLMIYSVSPFLLQIAGFALNAIYPDPIPFLDEFIMIMCMCAKLDRISDRISDIEIFAEDHPILFVLIILLIVSLVGLGGYYGYLYLRNGGSISGFFSGIWFKLKMWLLQLKEVVYGIF